ncbi:MAG: cysteine hydrolase [Spirochaetota bacterium]|nr:MAG: cysteine hydrolase [Spirochaetota bacterium]
MIVKYGLKLNPNGWFGISDEEWINPITTALVIIDMQNFDANREWLLIGARGTGTTNDSQVYYYRRVYNTVIPAIQKLLAFFRKHDLTVVHVFFASRLENASDMPPIWRLRFDQHAEDMGRLLQPNIGSPEIEIIEELKPLPGETVLSKVTGSTFLSTNLHNIFRYQGIKSFIACGVWGNSCVEDTVRNGCDLGYLVTYVEDGTASPDEEFHRASTRVLGEMYCQVRDSDWILDHMKKFKIEK